MSKNDNGFYGNYLLQLPSNWYFGSRDYREANLFEKFIFIIGYGLLMCIFVIGLMIISLQDTFSQKKESQQ